MRLKQLLKELDDNRKLSLFQKQKTAILEKLEYMEQTKNDIDLEASNREYQGTAITQTEYDLIFELQDKINEFNTELENVNNKFYNDEISTDEAILMNDKLELDIVKYINLREKIILFTLIETIDYMRKNNNKPAIDFPIQISNNIRLNNQYKLEQKGILGYTECSNQDLAFSANLKDFRKCYHNLLMDLACELGVQNET